MDGGWIGDDFKLLLVAVETHTRWVGKKGERRKGGYDNVSKEKKRGLTDGAHTQIPRES